MSLFTYREDFPEGGRRVELNSRVEALRTDDELGQLVQLREHERKDATTRRVGTDWRNDEATRQW